MSENRMNSEQAIADAIRREGVAATVNRVLTIADQEFEGARLRSIEARNPGIDIAQVCQEREQSKKEAEWARIQDAQVKQREPQVTEGLASLNQAVSLYEELSWSLSQRLELCLRPATECAGNECSAPVQPKAPLADSIDGYAQRVYGRNRFLMDLVERIELPIMIDEPKSAKY